MTFEEYQKNANETAIYPLRGSNIYYPALGLSGEAGEVAEKVKKIMRDKAGRVDEGDRTALKKELGDVLWYVSQVAYEFGLDLEDIAKENLEKLKSRQERGKLTGSGDNR